MAETKNLLPKFSAWKINNGTGTEVTDSLTVTGDGYGCSFSVTHESSYVYYQIKDPPFKGHKLKLMVGNFSVTNHEARIRIQLYDAARENYQRIERYSYEMASFPYEMEIEVPGDCGEFRIYVRPGSAAGGIDPAAAISISGLALYDTYSESLTALNFHKVLQENLPAGVTPGTEHVYFTTDGSNVKAYISTKEGKLIPIGGSPSGNAETAKYYNAYTQTWIDERKPEIIALHKEGQCITFLIAADIHVRTEDGSAGRYNQVRDLLMVTEQLPVDYICCCGDIMSYCMAWDGNVEPRAEAVRQIFGQSKVPWYCARGDHDTNMDSGNSAPDAAEFNGTTCNELFVTANDWHKSITSKLPVFPGMEIHFDDANPTGGYFYVDDSFRKHRMVFANSEETHETAAGRPYVNAEGVPECHISGLETERQVRWLVDKAMDMTGKAGWCVSFFSHKAPYTDRDEADCSEFHGYGSNMPEMRQIVKAFQNGTAVQLNYGVTDVVSHAFKEITVSKDFSAQGPVPVIGWFGGHVHDDCYRKVDGLNVFVSTCTCASRREDWSTDPTPAKLPPERNSSNLAMSLNCVIVNKTTRMVHVVKLGSRRDNSVKTSSDYSFPW